LTDVRDANCKVSQISRVFQKFDKTLSSQKIRNILQKICPSTSSSASRLQTFLEGLEEEGGDVFSKVDSEGNVAVLCITSYMMKRTFQNSLPPVVQVDTSFNIDSARYKLCGFCYLNPKTNQSEFGMLAFLAEETSVNLRAAFHFFKSMCTEVVPIFTVDKNFTEITVLKEVFPDATILLCVFHVLK